MKSIAISLIFFVVSSAAFAQKTLPAVPVKDLQGHSFNTGELNNDGKPMIINFWATWCAPCKRELNTIAEVYDEWQKETGVKLIAISIDDARSQSRVLPFINGSSWEYEIYIDANQDFKRAMGVNNVPHTFLVDGNGLIVWQHNNYSPGDEEELYDKIRSITNK
jgi:thiol-disulfide isomerase/thioredoxin